MRPQGTEHLPACSPRGGQPWAAARPAVGIFGWLINIPANTLDEDAVRAQKAETCPWPSVQEPVPITERDIARGEASRDLRRGIGVRQSLGSLLESTEVRLGERLER
jgi:hypothetical protein